MGHLLGHRYSHSTVSRITDLVLERVEAFRTRSLRRRYAIVYLDCLCVKVLREGGIRKEAVYVVLGIDPEGHREVLGFYLFPTSRRWCGRRSFRTCGSEGCGRYWCS